MKRVLSFVLTLATVLTCLAISAAAFTTTETPYPDVATKTNPDIVITPDNTNGATIADYDANATVMSTVDHEGKKAWKLGVVQATGKSGGAFKISGLNVEVSKYNYILVDAYYTGETGARPGCVAITGGTGITSWYHLYPHTSTTALSKDTRISPSDLTNNAWATLVIPIYNVDVMSASRTMAADGVINELSLLLHGNGGNGSDLYVSSVTFSESKPAPAVDLPMYEKTENYTVPFSKYYAYTNSIDLTVETIEGTDNPVLDGKEVLTVSKSENGTDGWHNILIGKADDSLNVKLYDYKYMVMKVYYELDKFPCGANNPIPIYHRSTEANSGDKWLGYFKAQQLKDDGTLVQQGFMQDNWLYLVYDLSAPATGPYTDTAKYPNGLNDTLQGTSFYPFGNGVPATGYTDMGNDTCYIQFTTFTNDAAALIAADKKADEDATEETEPETDPVTEPVTEPATEPATEAATKAPAATTDNTTEEKKGCASSAAFGVVAILAVAATGTLAVKKKKND